MVPEADFVVDLCCGSGSGCVAALRIGYHSYGIDRSTEQLEEAKRRVNIFMVGEAAQIQDDRELAEANKAAADVKTAAAVQAKADVPQLVEEELAA